MVVKTILNKINDIFLVLTQLKIKKFGKNLIF